MKTQVLFGLGLGDSMAPSDMKAMESFGNSRTCLIFAFILFVHLRALASTPSAETMLLAQIRAKIPAKLRMIQPGKTSIEEAIRLLGKPEKDGSGRILFYRLSHRRFDTTIGTEAGKIVYVMYSFPSKGLLLNDLKEWISNKEITDARRHPNHGATAHTEGSTFSIVRASIGLTITVRDDKRQTVDFIILGKP